MICNAVLAFFCSSVWIETPCFFAILVLEPRAAFKFLRKGLFSWMWIMLGLVSMDKEAREAPLFTASCVNMPLCCMATIEEGAAILYMVLYQVDAVAYSGAFLGSCNSI